HRKDWEGRFTVSVTRCCRKISLSSRFSREEALASWQFERVAGDSAQVLQSQRRIEQIAHLQREGVCDRLHRVDREVDLAALDERHMGTVNVRTVGQLFLRHLAQATQGTDITPEEFAGAQFGTGRRFGGGLCHGQKHPSSGKKGPRNELDIMTNKIYE